MLLHGLQVGFMEYDDQREVVKALKPLVEGDVEEVDDLSLEATEDDEVTLVDGVLKVHLVHLEMKVGVLVKGF
ncbi:hypothetical protein Tco_0989921 [Tanacetum coccineum]|uniref:Uncharacterized protein n=1 Tax=Tanacetum coccineum TaxID=301880 RepID=A0ABQ5EWK6_9ASTR